MSDNSNDLVVVRSVPDELEAAMAVNLLSANGIRAVADGTFTAGFRAEAPGEVAVRVRSEDVLAARRILAEAEPGAPPTG